MLRVSLRCMQVVDWLSPLGCVLLTCFVIQISNIMMWVVNPMTYSAPLACSFPTSKSFLPLSFPQTDRSYFQSLRAEPCPRCECLSVLFSQVTADAHVTFSSFVAPQEMLVPWDNNMSPAMITNIISRQYYYYRRLLVFMQCGLRCSNTKTEIEPCFRILFVHPIHTFTSWSSVSLLTCTHQTSALTTLQPSTILWARDPGWL